MMNMMRMKITNKQLKVTQIKRKKVTMRTTQTRRKTRKKMKITNMRNSGSILERA